MKKAKAVSLLLAAAMAAGALAGCGGKHDYAVYLGVLAPTSGNVSSYGKAALNGVMLAVKEANDAKMFDKEVGYKQLDEKGDIQEAVNAYRKLVDVEKVDAIIGDVTSGPSIDVAAAAKKDGIPMITPTGTAAPITMDKDNVFRACFLDATQGKAMASYAAGKFAKVAILFNQDDEYSVGLKDAFVAEAGVKGIEIVETLSYGKNDKDFKAQLTTISSKSPDAVYLPDYYNTVYTICQQKKDYTNLANIPSLGGDGWDGVLGIEGADAKMVEGCLFTNHYAMEDPSEKVQGFLKAYRETYDGKDPASFAALGYDATMIMLEAFKKAGSTEHSKVVEALKNTAYEGVTGKITFDADGNPLKPISIVEIKDGKYTLKDAVQ